MAETRLYSVFDKVDGKWVRVSELAFKKSVAVRVFQNRLISGFFDGRQTSLRVVKAPAT